MFSADEYRALREGAGIIDGTLSHARLFLTGADRRTYLQGLLTNDIVALSPGTGCYAAYLTAHGRMIADMWLFELGEALLVTLETAVAATVRGKWEMFVFSEDVRIEDRSAQTRQLGIYGPRAAHVLSAALADPGGALSVSAEQLETMPLYSSAHASFMDERVTILRSDEPGMRGFVVMIGTAKGDALDAKLAEAGGVVVTPDAIEVCRVEAGRPRFGIDMTEDTIPLEAGIEDRAISLTKGCYVGQEIIIRVLHRGHGRVAKRLVGLALNGSNRVPPRGSAVQAAGRDVGAITSAVNSPALGHVIALAYVHRDFAEPGTALTVDSAAAIVAGVPFV